MSTRTWVVGLVILIVAAGCSGTADGPSDAGMGGYGGEATSCEPLDADAGCPCDVAGSCYCFGEYAVACSCTGAAPGCVGISDAAIPPDVPGAEVVCCRTSSCE